MQKPATIPLHLSKRLIRLPIPSLLHSFKIPCIGFIQNAFLQVEFNETADQGMEFKICT